MLLFTMKTPETPDSPIVASLFDTDLKETIAELSDVKTPINMEKFLFKHVFEIAIKYNKRFKLAYPNRRIDFGSIK